MSERKRKALRKPSNAWGLHELRENIGLKTLFNGCLSQHSGSLPNTTMREDLVQRNWSQSCLLPGLPLADLKRRSHLSSESKPTGLLRVGESTSRRISGRLQRCFSGTFQKKKKKPFSFILTFFSSKHSYAKQVCVCVAEENPCVYPVAEHVVVQRPPRLQPDAFPGVFIRQEQTVVWSWNMGGQTPAC